MSIEVISEIVPKNAGNFPVARDTNLMGGFRVVADATARDAIPSGRRLAGMRVALLADGSEWVLRSDLTTWDPRNAAFRGDSRLLASLSDASDVLHLYVSLPTDPTPGSNLNTGLSPASPWAGPDFQFAFDQIPNGAKGTVIIHAIGEGPYDDSAVPRTYLTHDTLNIIVMADTTDDGTEVVLPLSTDLGRPQLDDGDADEGFQQAVYDVGTDPWTQPDPAIDSGTHWFEITGLVEGTPARWDQGFQYAFLARGDECDHTAGTLRLISPFFAPTELYTEVTARPFRTVLEAQESTWRTSILRGPQPGAATLRQSLVYVGFILGPNFGCTLKDVAVAACKSPLQLLDESEAGNVYVHSSGEVVMSNNTKNVYFGQSILSGFFEGTVPVQIFSGAIVLSGVYTVRDGSGTMVRIGSHSGGGPAPGCAVEVDGADFDPATSGNPFSIRHSNVRMCNTQGISLRNCSSFVTCSDHSHVSVLGRVYGKSTASCSVGGFSELIFSSAYDPMNVSHTDALLANNVDPGKDVTVGANAVVKSFTDLVAGVTDLASGNASVMARAQLG